MGISFNSAFNNQAGRQEAGLILKGATQRPPRPKNEKFDPIDADYVSVAASIVNPDADSKNKKQQQAFNDKPRFGNDKNMFQARQQISGFDRSLANRSSTPVEALEQKVDSLQQQVSLMQGQIASLIGSKLGNPEQRGLKQAISANNQDGTTLGMA